MGKELHQTFWEIKKYKSIDFHNHIRLKNKVLDLESAKSLLNAADTLGIEKICVSRPLTPDSPSPSDVTTVNNAVLEAMKFSERFIGFCFLNPGYIQESLKEMERCIIKGNMAGVKLYHQYLVCDPALTPVMSYAAELGVPVLMHSGKLTNPKDIKLQTRLSNSSHFIKAVKMFPNTIIVQGHIGGGGDWEWTLRVLEDLEKNAKFYIDTSGSVIDTGIVKKTVKTLGEDRVLFATDGSMDEGVGKVLDAKLSEKQLRKIFSGNFNNILKERR
ncbi:amidohydrolase family protein [bacterium]|nr:amidohydrolase family protein [bacterium]